MFPSFIPVYLSQHLPLFSLFRCLAQSLSCLSLPSHAIIISFQYKPYMELFQQNRNTSHKFLLGYTYRQKRIAFRKSYYFKKVQPCPHNLACQGKQQFSIHHHHHLYYILPTHSTIVTQTVIIIVNESDHSKLISVLGYLSYCVERQLDK